MTQFYVPGEPIPQGSKRAYVNRRTNRAVVVEDNPRHRDWRARVALAARQAHQGPLIVGPVKLYLFFEFARPRSHYGTGRNSQFLRASAPQHKMSKPDLDKLIRAVCDSLTGIVWLDDCLVVQISARKHWSREPGVLIVVRSNDTAKGE